MSRPRTARLIAEAVTILCPYCTEPQENRNGSQMWTLEDFDDARPRHTCKSCGKEIYIESTTIARFQ